MPRSVGRPKVVTPLAVMHCMVAGGQAVVLRPGHRLRADHPLVKRNPAAFGPERPLDFEGLEV